MKKVISFLSALAMMCSMSAAVSAEGKTDAFGDVDSNGRTQISDFSQIVRMIVFKRVDPSMTFGDAYKTADVDGDGDVDARDAYTVLSYYSEHAANKELSAEDYILTPEREKVMVELGLEDPVLQYWHPGAAANTVEELFEIRFGDDVVRIMDANKDNALDIADASVVLKAYAEKAAGCEIYKASLSDEAYDVNGDGSVDISDASLIMKAYAMKSAGLL